ncbi:glycoside hydrolase family 26 protein [Pedobacter arcticus]|uniref:glycoside hydrolase family 26 protein n=1 Tax=Pedobacter arcticus TaxID=752140 RepID=UPI0002E6C317|nr:glycosyl hydrolase [Pedobacter arcticus]
MKINIIILMQVFLFSLMGKANAQSLIDNAATKESLALYQNLHKLSKKHTMFGHQDDLAYGANWKYVPGKSDIKDIVNDFPAVYGWDIAGLELDAANNIDGVSFDKMRQYIKDGYKRGGVITISWHFNNPLSGGSSWDTTKNAVASILPGGIKHELYKNWLDKAAVFMATLKGDQGEAIPILFRPFHELIGNWFWWGKNTCSPAELKEAWRFTVDYLRNEKKMHNLIYVYNTNGVSNEEAFLERYPGDSYVDVVSFDLYQFAAQDKNVFIDSVKHELQILTAIASQKNKLAAFAETGFEAVPDPEWWTGTLWPAIKDFQLSYVLVWRNAGYMPSIQKMHYYAPFKGQVSAPDFKKFYKLRKIMFEKKLRRKNIYQSR